MGIGMGQIAKLLPVMAATWGMLALACQLGLWGQTVNHPLDPPPVATGFEEGGGPPIPSPRGIAQEEMVPHGLVNHPLDPPPVVTGFQPSGGPPIPSPPGMAPRRRIIVGLPVTRERLTGDLVIEPNVQIGSPEMGGSTSVLQEPIGEGPPPPASYDAGELPAPLTPPFLNSPVPEGNSHWQEVPPTDGADWPVEPVFGDIVSGVGMDDFCAECGYAPPLNLWLGYGVPELGIGAERLVFAPFELDPSQPQNQYRFRFDAAYDYASPDRAEILFAKPGKGPPAERSASYQDLRFMNEIASGPFSATTEIPIRILDPEVNGNTAGLGDMSVTTKLVLSTGSEWQLTQIFRTYINTGAVTKGLSSGHVSLEPGVLVRYRWNEMVCLHGELKYWFAVGGDPAFSGQVLRFGLGRSHILFESDTFAVLDTFEFVTLSVMDGQRTVFDSGTVVDVDGETDCFFFPGLRLVHDSRGDMGLWEIGFSGGCRVGNGGWYDGLVRGEIRWAY